MVSSAFVIPITVRQVLRSNWPDGLIQRNPLETSTYLHRICVKMCQLVHLRLDSNPEKGSIGDKHSPGSLSKVHNQQGLAPTMKSAFFSVN